ncbi:energy transducer TonB [Candidatus Palauibacter sp.]|uniref:energy transducer TonB n=1 Tax=Candidatus Palauibacter sp. TaxID=3101350 RepID=UPI003B525CD8
MEVPPVLKNPTEVGAMIVQAYPRDLFARGEGGRVEVWVHVDSAGNGTSGAVKTPSEQDALDCAAMQVADVMEYDPALDRGLPTEAWISEWVEFRPEAVASTALDPGGPPCEPWDEPPELLNPDDVGRWLERSYPPELRARGVGGLVVLRLQIGELGEVMAYEVSVSSGHEALDDAAGIVAMNMRYRPAKRLGRPISVWLGQPIVFMTQQTPVPGGGVSSRDRPMGCRMNLRMTPRAPTREKPECRLRRGVC